MVRLLTRIILLISFCGVESYGSSSVDSFKLEVDTDPEYLLSVKVRYEDRSEWIAYDTADSLNVVDSIEEVADINSLIRHVFESGYESRKFFFNRIILVPKILEGVETRSFHLLFKESDLELDTDLISTAITYRLKDFLSTKSIEQSLGSLSRHAYSLLLTMRAFNLIARDIPRDSALDAITKSGCHSALLPIITLQGSSNINCAVGAIDIAFEAHSKKCDFFSLNPEDFIDSIKDHQEVAIASDLSLKAALEVIKHSEDSVYNTTETESFLYLLKCFGNIVAHTYDIAFKNMTNIPGDNILSTKDRWLSFKEEWFVSQERAQSFLSPWLSEIDLIVEQLETLQSLSK